MTHRKFSLGAVLVLFVAQTVAMKRSGDELVKSESSKFQKVNQLKGQKSPTEKLYTAIKQGDSGKFAKVIHNEPDVVNAKINKEPVIFELLGEVDRRRCSNIGLFNIGQQGEPESLRNSSIIKEGIKAEIQQNDSEIEELDKCLKMVIQHKNFDTQCTNSYGDSVVSCLVKKPFEPEYSPIAEQALPSKSTQPILAAILKKDVSFCNEADEDGLVSLHYAAMMPISDEDNANDFVIDNVKSGRNALETIETLVHSGANINSVTPQGDTALHFTAELDLTKTSLLIALGADTNKRNQEGKIPADLSINPRVMEILNNPKKHIDDINTLVLQNSARETHQKSVFKSVNQQQMRRPLLNPVKNPCPYTQAVLQMTHDISAEDMIVEMGYELVADEDSSFSNEDSEYSDEDLEMIS